MGTKRIFLTDEPNEYYVKYKDRQQLKDILDKFFDDFYTEVYIYHPDLNELFKNFKVFFTYLESAGGIVFNKYGQVLLIRKNSVWDLHKGKIEKGETPEDAAIREVHEECGLDNLFIVQHIKDTYHIFKRSGKKFLKKTYWYKMIYKGYKEPKPLKSEGITKIQWFDTDKLDQVFQFMHPNLVPLLKQVI
jgi:8-oxo-dGTP pyrophosphatase MutT (NUDIX family)